MKTNIKDLLLYSLDNELTLTQQENLEKALAESTELQQEKEQLLQMRALVGGLRVRRDLDFPERVMNRLKQKEKRGFFSDLVALSPKVAAACIVFMLATTIGIYMREGNLSPDVIIGIEELTPEDAIGVQNERLFKTSTEKAMQGPEREQRINEKQKEK